MRLSRSTSNVVSLYYLLSLLPKAMLLTPFRVRIYTAFRVFWVVFFFKKVSLGSLDSMGVCVQFIFNELLSFLCQLELGG